MGTALATGWTTQPRAKPDITLVAPRPSALVKAMAEEEGLALNPAPAPMDVVVIAVKPQVFESAVEEIRAWIGPETLVVSVMAGFRLKQLAEMLETPRVVRAMPNTPSSIGEGVTLLTAPDKMAKKDINAAVRLLKPLGMVEGPIHETQFPSATALSGCGPAYVFLLVEAMAMAGESEGLSSELANRLARETVIGAAALLADSEDSPEALRRMVTSKGGVTEAALDTLMRGDGIPSLMRDAVRAAAAKERALSAGK